MHMSHKLCTRCDTVQSGQPAFVFLYSHLGIARCKHEPAQLSSSGTMHEHLSTLFKF